MKNNQVIIAAAGSGKTTYLVKKALELSDSPLLITTYTLANEKEIIKKFIELNNCIPKNITIQPWFSFLLQHGVRPYQSYLFGDQICGFLFVNSKSVPYVPESNVRYHYFSREMEIYSDKVSKFFVRCNEKSRGLIVDRLQRIYSHIFIDEIQDLAGYDLDILKILFESKMNILAVGDPRQSTYSTNSSSKNIQFRKALIVDFFLNNLDILSMDTDSLTVNYRCIEKICNLSNELYPEFPSTTSGNENITDHDGIYLVHPNSVDGYLEKFRPVQLRHSKTTEVNPNYRTLNFGDSKGLSFDRVLIYPTEPICNWLLDHNSDLATTSRAKLYVALTRARQSVGIVYEFDEQTEIKYAEKYIDE